MRGIGKWTSRRRHRNIVAPLNELAGIYHLQGKRGEAERHYKRSIAIVEKTFGPDSAALEVPLNGLVALYQAQGRKIDAEAAERRSFALANTRYRGQFAGPLVVKQRLR